MRGLPRDRIILESPLPSRFDRQRLPRRGGEEGALLVALCGASGSGKTQFAKQFFSKTEIVSEKECLLALTDRWGIAGRTEDEEVAGEVLMNHIISMRLHLGKTCVADARNLDYKTRDGYFALSYKKQIPLTLILITSPLETLLSFNKKRPAPAGGLSEKLIRTEFQMMEEYSRLIKEEEREKWWEQIWEVDGETGEVLFFRETHEAF